jgi:hypothetical protein
MRRAVLDCVSVRALSICPQSRRKCIGGLRNVDAEFANQASKRKARVSFNCALWPSARRIEAVKISHAIFCDGFSSLFRSVERLARLCQKANVVAFKIVLADQMFEPGRRFLRADV